MSLKINQQVQSIQHQQHTRHDQQWNTCSTTDFIYFCLQECCLKCSEKAFSEAVKEGVLFAALMLGVGYRHTASTKVFAAVSAAALLHVSPLRVRQLHVPSLGALLENLLDLVET